MRRFLLFIGLLFFMVTFPASGQNGLLSPDPCNFSGAVIDDLLSRKEFMMYRSDEFTGFHYAEACAGFGAIRLAGLLKDSVRLEKLSERYCHVTGEEDLLTAGHVDASVYGILPLELFLQTGERSFAEKGLRYADLQWSDTIAGGLTGQTRYWIDDIWMISSLQVQAYRATGNPVYLDRAALEISSYLKKLQQPNGLFFHGENAPFFWGRGNGWVAAGLAELLSELPSSNPYYSLIREKYQLMMNALVKYQDDSGMWKQLIDKDSSWEETSSTAMFGYAMATGINEGFLPDTFRMVCFKAWESLSKFINNEGKLSEICAGTGKSDDIQYYLNRPRITGDLHGQAALLWFITGLIRMENSDGSYCK